MSVDDSRAKCRHENCQRPARPHGYCQTHYYNARERGLLPGPKCAVEGCSAGLLARGLCRYHYRKAKRDGDIPMPACGSPGCPHPVHSCGYCSTHLRRFKLYGSSEVITKAPMGSVKGKPCSVPGCDCRHPSRYLLGGVVYCVRHWNRTKKYGDPHFVKRPATNSAEDKKRNAAERQRRYLATPHGKLRSRFNAAKNRALKYGCDWVTGITKEVFLAIYNQPVCGICKLPVPEAERSIDHVVPLSKGGANCPDNLQLAHVICNVRKNNRAARPVCVPARRGSACFRHATLTGIPGSRADTGWAYQSRQTDKRTTDRPPVSGC